MSDKPRQKETKSYRNLVRNLHRDEVAARSPLIIQSVNGQEVMRFAPDEFTLDGMRTETYGYQYFKSKMGGRLLICTTGDGPDAKEADTSRHEFILPLDSAVVKQDLEYDIGLGRYLYIKFEKLNDKAFTLKFSHVPSTILDAPPLDGGGRKRGRG